MARQTVWTDRGLFLLRIALGVVFVMHGAQKLFVFGLPGVAGMLGTLGVPFPGLNAVLVTAAELGGGLLLLAGAATRASAAIVAFTMAVAVLTAHISHGFFAPAGVEYPLTLLFANVALVLTGPGRYSVDAKFFAPATAQPIAAQDEWRHAA